MLDFTNSQAENVVANHVHTGITIPCAQNDQLRTMWLIKNVETKRLKIK